jgi:integration host factor subunit alpha
VSDSEHQLRSGCRRTRALDPSLRWDDGHYFQSLAKLTAVKSQNRLYKTVWRVRVKRKRGFRRPSTESIRAFTVVTAVTRSELTDAVYRQLGLSRTESSDLVEAMLEEISVALERGETVKLSSFGSFSVRHKNERIGRNPKSGVEVPITPRRVVTFKASHILKDRIIAHLSDTPPASAA